MRNRATRKKAAPGELRMFYGRLPNDSAPDVIIAHGGGGTSKRDAALLHWVLCCKRDSVVKGEPMYPSLLDDLVSRGYDLTTLEFRIRKKATTETKP